MIFLCHRHFTLVKLTLVSAIMARNGAGKTSILLEIIGVLTINKN
jgi:ABC-type branched-subunit amino acid transport system ATPase component